MRVLLVLSLSICLLFSVATMASADVFRITPEISNAKLETGSLSESGNVYYLSGDLNFIVVRTGIDLGYGEIEDLEYTTSGVRIGTELPLFFFKLIAYGGYQNYKFEGNGLSDEFKGTILGAGIEYELNDFFSLRGVVQVPIDMELKGSNDDIDFNSAKLDMIFTTLPLVDVFVGYRAVKFETDSRDWDLSGFTAGVRVGI